MILSVSRRTDIPCFYSEWFMNRVHEGFVYVPNPMNSHAISNVRIDPDVVDGIVFWSKNPRPMLPKLKLLDKYPFYFQFTVNGYGQDMERNLPEKKLVIQTFKDLSGLIGSKRVIWRYDPILITEKYTLSYHIKAFEELADMLAPLTRKCIISFVDEYRKTMINTKESGLRAPTISEMEEIAGAFSPIALSHDLLLETCAEGIDLEQFNIGHAKCVDSKLMGEIGGYPIKVEKDKNQRLECGCVESIDIGMYNTCVNNCLYCYASYRPEMITRLHGDHDPHSPLLCGKLSEEDKITERKMVSYKQRQQGMF